MKITAIELENIRGFQHLPQTELSQTVNVFIGPNNAGKSTILNAIHFLQKQVLNSTDITLGKPYGKIKLKYLGKHEAGGIMHENTGISSDKWLQINLSDSSISLHQRKYKSEERKDKLMAGVNIPTIPYTEPYNLIYPYLSKRKVEEYNDGINGQFANTVQGNFTFLYSKIDRLITPQFQPGNTKYVNACRDVLGFEISTLAKGGGKHAVYYIHNQEHIPLTAMGEGVANILGLIVDLCMAENQIFLIEEPENDIHPRALKALLKLIVEASAKNQFFISTHSNIVMKYLGGEPNTKIFKVTNDERDAERPNLFVSKLHEVANNPQERREVLEELGYEFHDFGLWKGWLFLEEASAEVFIRDYFLKWYFPEMQHLIRTFSAQGTAQIGPKLDDFNRLFVYLHLEPAYKNKVWVLIDGGVEEKGIIEKLKHRYTPSGWQSDHFLQLSKHDFEEYYPAHFQAEVEVVKALSKKDKKEKREKMEAKKILLDKVKAWIASDEAQAKEAFAQSAQEVIEILGRMTSELI